MSDPKTTIALTYRLPKMFFSLSSLGCLYLLGSSASAKSSTLPLPHRLNVERPYAPKERERDGYYR